MLIFSWPKVSRYSGEIVVRGRHTSQRTNTNADYGVSTTVFVTMAGLAASTYFYQRSWGTEPSGAIPLGIFFGMMGIIPGGILGLLLYPLFWLWFRPVTTVRVTTEAVTVDGMRYNRGDVPIEFSNLYTSAVGLQRTASSQTMVGTFDESKGLRMYYGGNAVLVTTFISAEKAGRFALACNAALSQVVGSEAGTGINIRRVSNATSSQTGIPVAVRPALPHR